MTCEECSKDTAGPKFCGECGSPLSHPAVRMLPLMNLPRGIKRLAIFVCALIPVLAVLVKEPRDSADLAGVLLFSGLFAVAIYFGVKFVVRGFFIEPPASPEPDGSPEQRTAVTDPIRATRTFILLATFVFLIIWFLNAR